MTTYLNVHLTIGSYTVREFMDSFHPDSKPSASLSR